MLIKIAKLIVPQRTVKMVRKYFQDEMQNSRAMAENKIPKVLLTARHMKNCELLLNRSALLSNLKKAAIVAELGVDHGDFSDLILKITEPKKLHLVDIWRSERYHDGLFLQVSDKFGEFVEQGCVQIHRKLSTDAATDFPDNYFDWIYIDTDHGYEVTRDELNRYALKVKSDGIIAGHDYSMGNWVKAYRYGVIEAVHEFCVENDWEFVYLTLEPTEKQSFAIRRINPK